MFIRDHSRVFVVRPESVHISEKPVLYLPHAHHVSHVPEPPAPPRSRPARRDPRPPVAPKSDEGGSDGRGAGGEGFVSGVAPRPNSKPKTQNLKLSIMSDQETIARQLKRLRAEIEPRPTRSARRVSLGLPKPVLAPGLKFQFRSSPVIFGNLWSSPLSPASGKNSSSPPSPPRSAPKSTGRRVVSIAPKPPNRFPARTACLPAMNGRCERTVASAILAAVEPGFQPGGAGRDAWQRLVLSCVSCVSWLQPSFSRRPATTVQLEVRSWFSGSCIPAFIIPSASICVICGSITTGSQPLFFGLVSSFLGC